MVKTKAIILKSDDFAETDRILTVFSNEFGKIKIMAKGVKKLGSKLRYSIEPISFVQLILVEGKNFLILKDAVLINEFLPIKNSLEKLKIVYKIIDLVNSLIIGEEKDDNIWQLLLDTFENINNAKKNNDNITGRFQNSLLKLLGYEPSQVKNLADIY